MRPSLLVQNATVALLFVLACYVVARYGLDAVVNQTMLENEFFHGRSKVSHRVN